MKLQKVLISVSYGIVTCRVNEWDITNTTPAAPMRGGGLEYSYLTTKNENTQHKRVEEFRPEYVEKERYGPQ